MSDRQAWRMPPPPPSYILSVRDDNGIKWVRTDSSGERWSDGSDRGPAQWDWLLYNRGTLTADEVAQ